MAGPAWRKDVTLLTHVRFDISSGEGSRPKKPVIWLKGRVSSPPFSFEARKETGVLLDMLQKGATLSMPWSRPMPAIGAGCHELRVRDVDHDWRLVYAIEREAILVLDVFSKKSEKTPWIVIESCRRRLARYVSGG